MKKEAILKKQSTRAQSLLAFLMSTAIASQAFANAWYLGPEMPTARNGAMSAVLPDGGIILFGGWTATSPNGHSAKVEVFYERTGSWVTKAELPVPTGDAAVVKDKTGQIWLFGGSTPAPQGAPDNIANSIYRYDPASDQWIPAGTMPTRRRQAKAVVDSQGFIYLIGGLTPTDNGSALVERFDPNTGSWTTLAPVITGRSSHAAFIDGSDRIFVVGGANGAGLLGSVECLDLRNLAAGWVTKAPMPAARHLQGALGADGLFYVVGGWDGWFVSRVDRYDPASDSWSAYAPLNFGNNTMTIVTGPSGRLYSIGGESSPMVKTPRVEYTDINFAHAEIIGSVVINGIVGQSYRVEYSSNLGGSAGWTTLTNVALPTSPFRVVDWGSAGLPNRFYRVTLVP